MTSPILIKNANIVNERHIVESDLRITGQYISRCEKEILATEQDCVIDASGMYLLPEMIDDQVHFREPGLTHKGTIFSESRAAVAGGITSFMEMPNVNPSTTTIDTLEKKHEISSQHSMANYAFYLGATEKNLDQIKLLNPKQHCGVKVFMGASTGDLLVEHPKVLDAIFRESPTLIVTYCESSPIINKNLERICAQGYTPSIIDHSKIRNTEACYASSSYAVNLAKKYQSQLHVLHITTEKELSLFESGSIENKHITAEACVHHLWFCDDDYHHLGNLIKCNPAIKSSTDRDALLKAIHSNHIDIIATDHAPHTWEEKQSDYHNAPAGLPLVEHALLTLFDHVKHQRLKLEQIVEKTAHNPSLRYSIKNRGFIREGYYADLVLVDINQATKVSHKKSRYLCKWTPFNGHSFSSSIKKTWINGQLVFNGEQVIDQPTSSMRLVFNR